MCRRRCAACNDLFTPRKNIPDQRFCLKRACQRERRRRWNKEKLKADADYRANQKEAQKLWREKNPDYWRRYRQSHPAYTARNREQQRQRNHRRDPDETQTRPSLPEFAKMDAYLSEKGLISGTYRLIPVDASGIAKMDAYVVEMRLLSGV